MASLLEWPVADETGVADSGGVTISWRRYGNAPQTILFIPTWNFVDSRVLRHQVDGLRGEFRLVTFDARGSGRSGHPSSGYSFEHHVDDVLSVLDATDTPTASVVAASLGTHVAVSLAARHPTRVRRLVLIAPPMDMPGTEEQPDVDSDGTPEPDWRTAYRKFVPWFIKHVFPEPGSSATIDEVVSIALEADEVMLRQQSTELDWDRAPRLLAVVTCPTLVIHGSADRTLSLEAVRAVAAALPRGALTLLYGLGHRPDIRRPDLVNPILAEFFQT